MSEVDLFIPMLKDTIGGNNEECGVVRVLIDGITSMSAIDQSTESGKSWFMSCVGKMDTAPCKNSWN